MISCERCEELINARLDGYLTGEKAPLLDAHLAQCPDCRKLDRDLTTLHERLKALSCDPPEDLIPSLPARAAKRRRRPWAAAVCAAAVILLAVAITPQVLPFGSSAGDTAAAESAEAPETMAAAGDAAPAEGSDGSPAAEEGQTQAETEECKDETLTEAQALTLLEDYLSRQGLSLFIAPGSLSADGSLWTFPARDPASGQNFLFSVSCTDALVEETHLP